ncbi:MAG: B12-binding domain-containing radical SAM protein [Deltaproteobacteria bacterium]|nr:B12-binding domain-containing radical SAM protein [Deltaproteobacteria bacterium]
MGLDILLINPPFRLIPPFKYKLIDPPRNLALLSAVLLKNNFTVKIYDMPILEADYETILPAIKKLNPKIIGILNRSTYSFPIVSKTARIIKQYNNQIPIIVGGTYVSFAPLDAMNQCKEIDYIVVGEGEKPLPSLAAALIQNKKINNIKGIVYRNNNNLPVITEKPSPINLDEIPLPAIDLIPIEKYVNRNERYILDISRGCKKSCPYCTSSFIKGAIRYRKPEQIIDEISIAYNKGFRNFYFVDDMFTANKELVQTICKEITKREFKIKWPCMSHVDDVDKETLILMKNAGCNLIAFGVETTTKKTLEEIGKLDQLSKIKTAFDLTKEYGIRPLAFVMFGMPNSSVHDELNTIRFLTELEPDAVGVFAFKPYPGTVYYNHPEKYGINIIDYDLYKWSQLDEPTHETKDISKDQIIEMMMICNYLYRSAGTFSAGIKYKRKKGVIVIKTVEGGLLYNPYVPPSLRKTDMYLNCVKLDKIHFEVISRFDGYHNIDDIAYYLNKLFDLPMDKCVEEINTIIKKTVEMDIIEEIPDVMSGKTKLNRLSLINGGGLV